MKSNKWFHTKLEVCKNHFLTMIYGTIHVQYNVEYVALSFLPHTKDCIILFFGYLSYWAFKSLAVSPVHWHCPQPPITLESLTQLSSRCDEPEQSMFWSSLVDFHSQSVPFPVKPKTAHDINKSSSSTVVATKKTSKSHPLTNLFMGCIKQPTTNKLG